MLIIVVSKNIITVDLYRLLTASMLLSQSYLYTKVDIASK